MAESQTAIMRNALVVVSRGTSRNTILVNVVLLLKREGEKMKRDNYFIKQLYMGSDGMDLKDDFLEFLKSELNSQNYEAMSDHQLFLQGGKKAIEEIIEALE